MKYRISESFPDPIIESKNGPFISIYMPSHRHSPDNEQDPIRFRNLVKKVEKSLDEKGIEKSGIIQSLQSLESDPEFFKHLLDGLVVLLSNDDFVIYKLQRPVEEIANVGDEFIIIPLIEAYQANDNYILLDLSKDEFKLYEGNRYSVRRLELAEDAPDTFDKIFDDVDTQKDKERIPGGAGGGSHFHGFSSPSEVEEKETEKYFRIVDKFVCERFTSQNESIPLIVAGLQENVSLFRDISKNPRLHKSSIQKNLSGLEPKEIAKVAWSILRDQYLKVSEDLISRYHKQQADDRATDNETLVLKATDNGAVDTLMLKEKRMVECEDSSCIPITSLNNLALKTLAQGGKVVVVDNELFTGAGQVLALLRF